MFRYNHKSDSIQIKGKFVSELPDYDKVARHFVDKYNVIKEEEGDDFMELKTDIIGEILKEGESIFSKENKTILPSNDYEGGFVTIFMPIEIIIEDKKTKIDHIEAVGRGADTGIDFEFEYNGEKKKFSLDYGTNQYLDYYIKMVILASDLERFLYDNEDINTEFDYDEYYSTIAVNSN